METNHSDPKNVLLSKIKLALIKVSNELWCKIPLISFLNLELLPAV